ncbi:hypothetical protein EWM64_g9298 [Hericium alpestre]|uniref:Uncharacterized protein n=1 Tax=Hericium alpestre TaxID=135208 RepID=A0A4Y9ZL81_9AGAM|nr:hypothetical protein EWM64_g9298 [Hericium alpestre]
MSSLPSSTRPQPRSSTTAPEEPKPRGANRSTKVAGKLKVLPEQPEPEPVPTRKVLLAPRGKAADKGEGAAETGESEEEEGEEEEEETTEDVEQVYDQIARMPAWDRS